jgi:hypothetical protein
VLARRRLYPLLFAVPALLVSAIVATVMLAAAAGVLWLFVYGDNAWPETASTMLGVVFVVAGVGLWVALLAVAYLVGKRQESRPTLNVRHVALAVGSTVVLVALIVMHLFAVGLTGPQSDSALCADFCQSQGFVASGMPPRNSGDRTCSCYDASGREARRVPVADLETTKP